MLRAGKSRHHIWQAPVGADVDGDATLRSVRDKVFQVRNEQRFATEDIEFHYGVTEEDVNEGESVFLRHGPLPAKAGQTPV